MRSSLAIHLLGILVIVGKLLLASTVVYYRPNRQHLVVVGEVVLDVRVLEALRVLATMHLQMLILLLVWQVKQPVPLITHILA